MIEVKTESQMALEEFSEGRKSLIKQTLENFDKQLKELMQQCFLMLVENP